MTVEDLIAFEAIIAEAFNLGQIRAPIHLSGGNEQQLIDIFKDVQSHDWVCTTWRSHYHCLLKGVPPEQLKADIMSGKSITLTYPEYRIISSAIVGGIIPIALGIAWSIKRREGKEKVWCFIGDMTEKAGIYHECWWYARGHDLPIMFVVENNGLSVCTDTKLVWDDNQVHKFFFYDVRYDYKLPFPHAGAGKRVQF